MIVEWRKPLEVEVDEGLGVCTPDLDQQEDHPNKEQCLLKERELRFREWITDLSFLKQALLFIGVIFLLIQIRSADAQPFIYFNF